MLLTLHAFFTHSLSYFLEIKTIIPLSNHSPGNTAAKFVKGPVIEFSSGSGAFLSSHIALGRNSTYMNISTSTPIFLSHGYLDYVTRCCPVINPRGKAFGRRGVVVYTIIGCSYSSRSEEPRSDRLSKSCAGSVRQRRINPLQPWMSYTLSSTAAQAFEML